LNNSLFTLLRISFKKIWKTIAKESKEKKNVFDWTKRNNNLIFTDRIETYSNEWLVYKVENQFIKKEIMLMKEKRKVKIQF
jgi:mRNA degradation ribonuclease J1/J2